MGSNALVEENHQSGNCNIVTKSLGSSIKIDSISIDLVSPNDKGNAAKCEHFSICGYVSEIRQKDWRKCWPFSLDHNPNKSVEQTCMLPPLEVPKFKWWHCQHCLLEFGTKEAAKNYGTDSDHSTSGLKENTVCSHGMSAGGVVMLPSKIQKALKLDIVEGRNFDVNSSKLSTDCELSSCRDRKENETEVVKCPNRGQEIDSEIKVSRNIPPFSYVATEDVSNLVQKKHNPDGTVAFCAQCNGSGNFCEHGCGQIEHADRNLNCMASINVAETRSKGKETSVDNQLTELRIPCGTVEEEDETLNANKRHATRHPSFESEECDRTSSESAAIPIGNNIRDHHRDKAISLHRRKTKKVRLLTELLCEKGDADSNHFRKEESSSHVISDAFVDADTLHAPQGMAAIEGNVRSTGANRKRKLPHDEEWRYTSTSFLDNTDKRVGVLKRDTETTNAIAGPELEKDLVAGMSLQTGMKSDVSKCRTGKSPIIGKKKNGRTHVLGECEPLGPSQMGVPRKLQDETRVGYEGSVDDDVSFKLAHDAFVGREMDLSLLQKKDFCNESNGKKNIKIHEPSFFTKKDMNRADNGSEQVTMDDVPMEIVELMAKNQYERCLPDAENDKIPINLNNFTGNFQTRDFNKPCSSATFSSFHREEGRKHKPHAKNGRNGMITRCEIVGSSKSKSAGNLYQADKNHFTMSQLGQNQTFQHPEEQSSGFQYSAGSSSRQNVSESCKWIGDMVGKRPPDTSCLQMFGACNTSPGVPWQRQEGAKIWPSILPNNSPFRYNVPQKHAVTSTDIDFLSHCPGTLHNENPNGERDMKFFNQKAARVGKHKENHGSKSIGRTHAENLFACKHDAMKLQHKMSGSLDLYANEAIPAMHLLSLVDAGLRSSKPISMDVNPKFLKKPLMPHDSQPDFSGLESVVRSPSYDFYSKNKVPETSHEPFPTFPTIGAPASLFQHDRSSKKAADFPDEVSWKSEENKKRKASVPSAQNKGCGPHKSLSTEGGFGTGSGSVPARCKLKMFLGASDPMVFPCRFRGKQGSTKGTLEAPCATATVQPLKRSSETEVCSINRNPADFSLPEAGNLYTIGGEDLKFRAPVTHVNRSGLERLNGRKRQPKTHGMKQLIQHRA